MKKIREALERLDDQISMLENRIHLDASMQNDGLQRQAEMLKASKIRETQVLAAAQKVASRLDQTIEHVETILSH